MRKIVITAIIFCAWCASYAFADATAELKARLAKINSFHANFSQLVTDQNGTVLQQASGELWVKRPDLFNWHTNSPDENVLISDGKTLWFYNPFVEQVTALWLKNATSDTPFMLIARNQSSDWQQYNISQQGDNFTLMPKQPGTIRQFTLKVSNGGAILQFSVLEQDGQRSSYQLNNLQNGAVPMNKFTFTPPKGVTVDDQRQ